MQKLHGNKGCQQAAITCKSMSSFVHLPYIPLLSMLYLKPTHPFHSMLTSTYQSIQYIYYQKKEYSIYLCIFFHYVRADPSGPFFGFQFVLLYSDQGLAPYSFKHSNYWMSPNRNNPIVESLTRAVHTITIAAYPKPGSTPMDWFCVHHGYSTFRCLLS